MNNLYDLFFLSPDCTDDELEAKYRELKAQYSEDRFLYGEEGRRGAVNLENLENAYTKIKRERATEQKKKATGNDSLDVIDEMIKRGELDYAQKALDEIEVRDARWHYLQAIIFYKRNWYNDSLQQLNIALGLDPSNAQYQKSKEILERNMQSVPRGQEYSGQAHGIPMDDSMGMSSCCSTLCCASCCCDMLRCFGCG